MKRWLIGAALAVMACAHATTTAPARSVAAAAWLTGRWVDPDGGGETWTRVGEALVGVGWLRSGDGAWNYEVMRVDAPDGLRFTAWPSGQAATHFKEQSRGATEVVFAAPEHDFPKVIRYAQRHDRLNARVEGDDAEDGHDFSYVAASVSRSEAAEAADRALDAAAWGSVTAKVWRGNVPVEEKSWGATRTLLTSGAGPGGALAFTTGTYERGEERGDYVFVWRRGEAWKLELAIFNRC